MSSSLRRGGLAATAVFTLIPLTAACGAGLNAETNLVQPPNASRQIDDVKIESINVVLSEDGPAAVTGRIFNDSTEPLTLLSITLPDSGEEFELVPVEGESTLEIPAKGSIGLGGEGNAGAFVTDAEGAGVLLGNAQALVFDIQEVGTAELRATVVPMVGVDGAFAHYELWGPDGIAGTEDDPAEDGTDDSADADGAEDGTGPEDGEDEGQDTEGQGSDGQSPGETEEGAGDTAGTGTEG
ncbi:DUF461 domain-containing protein [Streptomyces spiramenti]|uniref:DUF461 domain-containing protein n=1 Tax=Streptomyces spiramenti TaxID=2720606 RepID=A0ABX1AK01_9ACTN|nr:DUF461 domain-containing protein [Streptomyces spiramenti]NJP65991.1 DUF461 domain-containing protein [Streptomyces spiramenti]